MDVNAVLHDLVDFMLANPTSTGDGGAAHLVVTHGWLPDEAGAFLLAFGGKLASIGLITNPVWEDARDKAVALGAETAKAACDTVAVDMSKHAAVQLVTMRDAKNALDAAQAVDQAKLPAIDAAISGEADPDVLEALQKGRNRIDAGAQDMGRKSAQLGTLIQAAREALGL